MALSPINPDAIKARLAEVAKETVASDPKALRAALAERDRRITELEKSKSVPAPATSQSVAEHVKEVEASEKRGYDRAKRELAAAAEREIKAAHINMLGVLAERLAPIHDLLKEELAKAKSAARPDLWDQLVYTPESRGSPVGSGATPLPRAVAVPRPPRATPSAKASGDGSFTRPQMRILESLAMWAALGHASPSREMVAAIAGYSPSSGGFNNLLGQIKTAGAIDYPQPGLVALAVSGIGAIGKDEARAKLAGNLTNPQARIVGALVDQGERTREELGADTGYSPSSGGFNNLLGQLRTLGLIDYPRPGAVIMSDWAQELLSGWRAAA